MPDKKKFGDDGEEPDRDHCPEMRSEALGSL